MLVAAIKYISKLLKPNPAIFTQQNPENYAIVYSQ